MRFSLSLWALNSSSVSPPKVSAFRLSICSSIKGWSSSRISLRLRPSIIHAAGWTVSGETVYSGGFESSHSCLVSGSSPIGYLGENTKSRRAEEWGLCRRLGGRGFCGGSLMAGLGVGKNYETSGGGEESEPSFGSACPGQ